MDAARPWFFCFSPAPGKTEVDIAIAVDMLTVARDQIYTGKLPHTNHMIASIRNKEVHVLGQDADHPSLQDVLGLLCVIATHSLIARTRQFRLASPGFWIRTDAGRIRPVMPMDHLRRMTSCPEVEMRPALQMLIRDGAIQMLRGPDGTMGVCLSDNYIHDREVRRFIRQP